MAVGEGQGKGKSGERQSEVGLKAFSGMAKHICEAVKWKTYPQKEQQRQAPEVTWVRPGHTPENRGLAEVKSVRQEEAQH